MRKIETAHYTRIGKAEARKRYERGEDVFFCPVNSNPDSPWGVVWCPPLGEDFRHLCEKFRYYNCDAERGYYPAFYIERGTEA